MNHTTMSNKINIAEILKDCPKEMKLFSLIEGEVIFNGISTKDDEYPIFILDTYNRQHSYTKEGFLTKGYPNAECILFPSSEMRDWNHFFKRGDVLIKMGGGMAGMAVIFDGWANDAYTKFNTTINLYCDNNTGEEEVCLTILFRKADEEERKQFIKRVETLLKGKYNFETLQVEPIKPECEFKPFDQVLVRDGKKDEKWKIGLFSHYDWSSEFVYVSLGHKGWKYCIPYNEQTAHLLNTTDPYNK